MRLNLSRPCVSPQDNPSLLGVYGITSLTVIGYQKTRTSVVENIELINIIPAEHFLEESLEFGKLE